MPAPIILQDQSGLAEGLSKGFSSLEQGLNTGIKEQKNRSGLDAFNTVIDQAGGDPKAIAQAYTQALNSGANPQQLSVLSSAYQSARKNNAFKTAYDDALEAGGMDSNAGKNAFILGYNREGGDPLDAFKFFKKDNKKQTVFDKKIDEFKAQSVIDYVQGGAASSKTFNDNLDFLEANVSNVGRKAALTGGGAGLLGGGEYGPFQSAAFSEYERRGNLVLDGVIKVFNKAGVLPEKKLKWIRENFAVSPFDTQEQIKGRLGALRSLSKETSKFDEGIAALVDQHGDDIPSSDFLKLQRNLNKSFDKFEEQFASPQKEQVYNKLPTSGLEEGDLATDTDSGQKFIWSGSRWVKKK